MSYASEQHEVYLIQQYNQDIPKRIRTLQQPVVNGTVLRSHH